MNARKESILSEEEGQLATLPEEMIQEITNSKNFSLHEMRFFACTNKHINKSIGKLLMHYTSHDDKHCLLSYRQVVDRLKLFNKIDEKIKKLSLPPSGLSRYFLTTPLPSKFDFFTDGSKTMHSALIIGITSSLLMHHYVIDAFHNSDTFLNASLIIFGICILLLVKWPTMIQNDFLRTHHAIGVFIGGEAGMLSGGIYGYFKDHALSRAGYGAMYGATFGCVGTFGLGAAYCLGLYAGKYYVNSRVEKKKTLIEELRLDQEKLRPFLRK